MVKFKRNLTKRTLIASIITILLLGCILAVLEINRRDTQRQKEQDKAAAIVGIARAKQECRTEGISEDLCEGITGSARGDECGRGGFCWIVYAHSKDQRIYRASMIVDTQAEEYVVIDYLRDTGKK